MEVILCLQDNHMFDRGGGGEGDDRLVGDEGKEARDGTNKGDIG